MGRIATINLSKPKPCEPSCMIFFNDEVSGGAMKDKPSKDVVNASRFGTSSQKSAGMRMNFKSSDRLMTSERRLEPKDSRASISSFTSSVVVMKPMEK
jgi:hypothetical protein